MTNLVRRFENWYNRMMAEIKKKYEDQRKREIAHLLLDLYVFGVFPGAVALVIVGVMIACGVLR